MSRLLLRKRQQPRDLFLLQAIPYGLPRVLEVVRDHRELIYRFGPFWRVGSYNR